MSTSAADKTAYDFAVKDKRGNPVSLKTIADGKVSLFVNVASKCGFTGQYDGLQKLQDRFQDKGFSVLAFPCNQFGGQEPGTLEEIETFVCSRFKGTFPIFDKVDVNGPNADPLWVYLKDKSPNCKVSKEVWWNFEKILVDRSGKVTKRYGSSSTPDSIAKDIEGLL